MGEMSGELRLLEENMKGIFGQSRRSLSQPCRKKMAGGEADESLAAGVVYVCGRT